MPSLRALSRFHERSDHIFILNFRGGHRFEALASIIQMLIYILQMVVEPYPVRVLAADLRILSVFKRSRSGIFHPHVVAGEALRSSSNSMSFTYTLPCKETDVDLNAAHNIELTDVVIEFLQLVHRRTVIQRVPIQRVQLL